MIVTVAVAVVLPFGPFAVSVYVVVLIGFTDCLPVAATVPMPLLIETSLAFVVVQFRVDVCPASMRVGSAVNVAIGRPGVKEGPLSVLAAPPADGGGGGGGSGVCLPHPAVNRATATKAEAVSVRLRLRNEVVFIVISPPKPDTC